MDKKMCFSIAKKNNTEQKTSSYYLQLAVIKCRVRVFTMSDGNTCIAEPNLEVYYP